MVRWMEGRANWTVTAGAGSRRGRSCLSIDPASQRGILVEQLEGLVSVG